MIPLIVVAGPTASGKTALAIELSKRLGGEVVSADSMQIYKGMDIGTAKPSAREKQGVCHHLIDLVQPNEDFSVGRYSELAHAAIRDIHSRGQIPILAGGTGLYIDTVVDNIKLSEDSYDKSLREGLTRQAQTKGSQWLYETLKSIDPDAAARLHVNDVKRVMRALEQYYLTGKTKTENDRLSLENEKIYDYLYFAIETPRDVLYNRINMRVDKMMQNGLLEEAREAFLKAGSRKAVSMQGIGYKQALYYFDGLATKEETARLIKRDTRRYAKRQLTWFRKRSEIIWVSADGADICERNWISRERNDF